MWLLFKTSLAYNDLPKTLSVKHSINGCLIAHLPEEYYSRTDIQSLNPFIISEEEAKLGKCVGVPRSYVSYYATDIVDGVDRKGFTWSPSALGEVQANGKYHFVFTDEDKVNIVSLTKKILTLVVEDRFSNHHVQIDRVSTVESATWEQQKAEAVAYTADNTVSTPVLSILANNRSMTVAEFAVKVLENVEEHQIKLANLLAQQQIIEQEIKSCVTMEDTIILLHNRFGTAASMQFIEEHGLDPAPLDLNF